VSEDRPVAAPAEPAATVDPPATSTQATTGGSPAPVASGPTDAEAVAMLAASGPFAVATTDYALDDFAIPGLPRPVEVAAQVIGPVGAPGPLPLVVLLHGCTQHAVGFATDGGWLALADEAGFAVLAPQQSSANNMNRCFNWFEPQDLRRGRGEPASNPAVIPAARPRHGPAATAVPRP